MKRDFKHPVRRLIGRQTAASLSSVVGSDRRRNVARNAIRRLQLIASSAVPVHDLLVVTQRKADNSFLWALGNLILTAFTFLGLYTVRFSGIGIWLVKFIFVGFLGCIVFSVRDVWRSTTRARGFFALLLCLPVLMFCGILGVWEGPLYVSVDGSTLLEFQIDGAAGFHGLKIYGPEHQTAEWRGDDIGLVWSFAWETHDEFPPMRLRFAYGVLPSGYSQKTPMFGAVPPALNSEVTYTIVIQPAMGMPEHFALHGRLLSEAEDEYAAAVCWAPLSVPGRSDPAYVRADCETKRFLPMSQRGQERLKAYQENRVVYY